MSACLKHYDIGHSCYISISINFTESEKLEEEIVAAVESVLEKYVD